jgi:hypothetical protein
MGALSGAASLYFTYKFLRILTQKWEDTDAFKLGIVDKDGKTLRKVRDLKTSEEKDAYSVFNRLAFNLKRILNKLPFGKTALASYAAALFLIKEHSGASDEQIEEVLTKMDIDVSEFLGESTDEWFIGENQVLTQGVYTLTENACNFEGDMVGQIGTKVVVEESCEPIGFMLGHNIYKVKHQMSNQDVYITSRTIQR